MAYYFHFLGRTAVAKSENATPFVLRLAWFSSFFVVDIFDNPAFLTFGAQTVQKLKLSTISGRAFLKDKRSSYEGLSKKAQISTLLSSDNSRLQDINLYFNIQSKICTVL